MLSNPREEHLRRGCLLWRRILDSARRRQECFCCRGARSTRSTSSAVSSNRAELLCDSCSSAPGREAPRACVRLLQAPSRTPSHAAHLLLTEPPAFLQARESAERALRNSS